MVGGGELAEMSFELGFGQAGGEIEWLLELQVMGHLLEERLDRVGPDRFEHRLDVVGCVEEIRHESSRWSNGGDRHAV